MGDRKTGLEHLPAMHRICRFIESASPQTALGKRVQESLALDMKKKMARIKQTAQLEGRISSVWNGKASDKTLFQKAKATQKEDDDADLDASAMRNKRIKEHRGSNPTAAVPTTTTTTTASPSSTALSKDKDATHTHETRRGNPTVLATANLRDLHNKVLVPQANGDVKFAAPPKPKYLTMPLQRDADAFAPLSTNCSFASTLYRNLVDHFAKNKSNVPTFDQFCLLHNGVFNLRIHRGDRVATDRFQFHIRTVLGCGAYGQVFEAEDVEKKDHRYALKFLNSRRFGKEMAEVKLLVYFQTFGRESGTRHILQLSTFFMYRGIIPCLVFRQHGVNLFEYMTRNGSFKLNEVITITKQILLALREIHSLGFVHSDIKPENILFRYTKQELVAGGREEEEDSFGVPRRLSVLVIDVGTAFPRQQRTTTISKYIQSRFYRAPEVILQLRSGDRYLYDTPIDLWSLGCVAMELYLGKPLFVGNHAMQMLASIEYLLGALPDAMVALTTCSDVSEVNSHQERVIFEYQRNDLKYMAKFRFKGVRSLHDFVRGRSCCDQCQVDIKCTVKDRRRFIDFISKLLVLTPRARLTVAEAMQHRIFRGRFTPEDLNEAPKCSPEQGLQMYRKSKPVSIAPPCRSEAFPLFVETNSDAPQLTAPTPRVLPINFKYAVLLLKSLREVQKRKVEEERRMEAMRLQQSLEEQERRMMSSSGRSSAAMSEVGSEHSFQVGSRFQTPMSVKSESITLPSKGSKSSLLKQDTANAQRRKESSTAGSKHPTKDDNKQQPSHQQKDGTSASFGPGRQGIQATYSGVSSSSAYSQNATPAHYATGVTSAMAQQQSQGPKVPAHVLPATPSNNLFYVPHPHAPSSRAHGMGESAKHSASSHGKNAVPTTPSLPPIANNQQFQETNQYHASLEAPSLMEQQAKFSSLSSSPQPPFLPPQQQMQAPQEYHPSGRGYAMHSPQHPDHAHSMSQGYSSGLSRGVQLSGQHVHSQGYASPHSHSHSHGHGHGTPSSYSSPSPSPLSTSPTKFGQGSAPAMHSRHGELRHEHSRYHNQSPQQFAHGSGHYSRDQQQQHHALQTSPSPNVGSGYYGMSPSTSSTSHPRPHYHQPQPQQQHSPHNGRSHAHHAPSLQQQYGQQHQHKVHAPDTGVRSHVPYAEGPATTTPSFHREQQHQQRNDGRDNKQRGDTQSDAKSKKKNPSSTPVFNEFTLSEHDL